MADRVLEVASRVAGRLASRGEPVEPRSLAGPAGASGARRPRGGDAARAGGRPPDPRELAGTARADGRRTGRVSSGRGLRSGIGLHGFALGGLIVDGGRRGPEGIPPLLSRLEFPGDWSVLVVIPRREPGRARPSRGPGVRRTAPLARRPDRSPLPAGPARPPARPSSSATCPGSARPWRRSRRGSARDSPPPRGGHSPAPSWKDRRRAPLRGLRGRPKFLGSDALRIQRRPDRPEAALLARLRARFGLDPERRLLDRRQPPRGLDRVASAGVGTGVGPGIRVRVGRARLSRRIRPSRSPPLDPR